METLTLLIKYCTTDKATHNLSLLSLPPISFCGVENQGNCKIFGFLENCIYGNNYSCILSNSLSPLSYLWNRNLEIAELW